MFKILIIISLLLTLIIFFFPKPKRPYWINFLPWLVVVFVIIHLIFWKYQWQMIPVYALTSIIFIISLTKFKKTISNEPESHKGKFFKYISIILGLLLSIVASAVLYLFPIVNLPKPTGPYVVGTTLMSFNDTKRPEILTDDLKDTREFMARIWYPVDFVKGNSMFYKENIQQVGIIEPSGPPNFIFSHYNLIKTNSYLDTPISNQQLTYPVLLFSPGFLASYEDYQILIEELASHGYIIFAPNQPYESQSVIYPDSKIVPFSEEHLKKYKENQENLTPLWKEFWTTTDQEKRIEISKKILDSESFMDTVLRVRTADIQFMVDEMEKMNSGNINNIFSNKLDLSRLGILGHSMGGAVAGQVCSTDNRFKACVNLDGFQWGNVVKNVIKQPFMIMQSETFAGANDFILNQFKNKFYLVTIKDSKHMNFDDNQIIMPSTKLIGMTGKIDAKEMLEITNNLITSFFDKYISDKNTTFPNKNITNYPEVEIKDFNSSKI